MFCLKHQNGRTRVWRHRCEHTLADYIRQCHTEQSPGLMDNARPHAIGIVRTFLNTEKLGCCPALPIHQVYYQQETFSPLLPNDWLVIIVQSLRLMGYEIVLKLHGYLYLYMTSNLYLTQSPGV
ncbi:hypothetical protein TNCV_3343611 [Trichonephila clavipes]|nr:hypothetical protein TNCV_3343611 [Trichonephila clavipes]